MLRVDVWIGGYAVVRRKDGHIFTGIVQKLGRCLEIFCEQGLAAVPWDSIEEIHCS